MAPAFTLGLVLAISPSLRCEESSAAWSAHVGPLLQRHCIKCHGATRKKGGVDLRLESYALSGGEDGPIVVAGRPEESAILRVLLPDADPRMPPSGDLLTDDEVSLVRAWIDSLGRDAAPGAAPSAVTSDPRSDPRSAQATDRSSASIVPGLSPRLAVDFLIARRQAEAGVEPSPLADDRTFARRVWLDLVGRIPTRAELEAFLAEPRSTKREDLVDRLLDSEEHARRMREIFDVVLMGRKGPKATTERQAHRWHEYLERAFRENRPWNGIVRDLLVARPESATDMGAAWFLFERKDDHQRLAEDLAPALLGLQVQCAQCHDHPIAPEIRQRHYWGLVSFFGRSKNVRTNVGFGLTESAIGGHAKFADLEGQNHPALPLFLDGSLLEESRPADGEEEKDSAELYVIAPDAPESRGWAVPLASRRAALASFAVESEYLARAFVNRMWALLLGRGLVHPVDKMDSVHPPSHPELLDWLAEDFRRSGHDVRRLVRELVLSRTYQLAARPADSESGVADPSLFARGLDKPLSAEAIARSLLIAVGDGATPEGVDAEDLERACVEVFPDLFAEENVSTLRQALFVTNSPTIDRLLAPSPGHLVARLLLVAEPEARVAEAFLSVLGRTPDPEELAAAVTFLAERRDRPEDGARHLVWALLASAEFSINH